MKLSRRRIIWIIASISTLCLITLFLSLKPSNDRDWESGYQTLAHIDINGNDISIQNIRNWSYNAGGPISFDYINEAYNTNYLKKVWFVVEPFSKFNGVAHTYFIFDFVGKEPVAFSVEARREKGETFNAFVGIFKKYEVYHAWGLEKDLTGRRVIVENDKLYMYPLDISNQTGANLFKEVALETQTLESKPKFYNTLTSNCTSLLAKYANKVKAESIPLHYSYILPGYSAEYLYKLKYIANDANFKDLKVKSDITNIVKEAYYGNKLSQKIRDYLK